MEFIGVCPSCNGNLIEDSGEYGYKCDHCYFPYGLEECPNGICEIKFTEEN